jgi:hypothetical protein
MCFTLTSTEIERDNPAIFMGKKEIPHENVTASSTHEQGVAHAVCRSLVLRD